MATSPSSRPSFPPARGLPLGLILAGMIGLQILVVVVAVVLRLPVFAGRN